MGEKRCQVAGCRRRYGYTVSILMGQTRNECPAIEVRLCSAHMNEFLSKPRPEVEKEPGCFEFACYESGCPNCLDCDWKDRCREKKYAGVEKR
jgi:hypothetical protein